MAAVTACYDYPPQSVWRQSLYTALVGQGGLLKKTAVPPQEILKLSDEAKASRLFIPAGLELKCVINRKMSDEEISWLIQWLESLARVIREHGLKE